MICKDTLILLKLTQAADSGISAIKFRFDQDMEYSLSCTSLLFLNWKQGDNTNIVSFFHQIKYRSLFTNDRNIKISNSFTHDLGIQYFFDSISRFQPDDNTLDTKVEIKIGKNITFSFFSNLNTRIFNSYLYANDNNGNLLKTLSTSFLTPLQWTFSAGLGWNFPQLGSLSLGLSAAKLTWILNKDVFKQQEINEFYGVAKGKTCLLEYGFSMHLLADADLMKRLHWNCDLLIFKNFGKPIDLEMKNFIGFRINKFLKMTIQTRLHYEKAVSKNIQVENLLSLGLYFHF